ncbi:MAG TPA: thiamine-phosphate kinase [Salinisphaeraceae bacterium]|nr:thiamine-phosphate kinase [Salinisphaeraceae bacterium]
MREFDLIRVLTRRLRAARADTHLALGDDAAVLAPPAGHELVVSTDTLVAGRHFPRDAHAADIGFKALAVSLSDVAAMGAEPAWATLALTLPELDSTWCKAFVEGLLQAPGAARVDIVGGDTTRGPLSVTTTVFGLVPAGTAVRRSGAQAGDLLCVTGTLGDAALGLRLWQARPRMRENAHAQWLWQRLHRPQWRRGSALRGRAHAAIDISDGLLADAGHILVASGCGARIQAAALPCSPAFAALCPQADRHALQLAGGDDYELCIVVPRAAQAALAAQLDCPLTVIGVIEAQPGLSVVDAAGAPLPTGAYPGWDHFRS